MYCILKWRGFNAHTLYQSTRMNAYLIRFNGSLLTAALQMKFKKFPPAAEVLVAIEKKNEWARFEPIFNGYLLHRIRTILQAYSFFTHQNGILLTLIDRYFTALYWSKTD